MLRVDEEESGVGVLGVVLSVLLAVLEVGRGVGVLGVVLLPAPVEVGKGVGVLAAVGADGTVVVVSSSVVDELCVVLDVGRGVGVLPRMVVGIGVGPAVVVVVARSSDGIFAK